MINKQIYIVLMLIAAFGATPVHASATKNKGFVGLDVQANHLTLDPDLEAWTMNGTTSFIKNDLAGVSLFGGYRWDRFAFEVGITGLEEAKYSGTARSGTTTILNSNLTQKNVNSYLDVLGFYPLNDHFEFKALIGLGVLVTQFDGNIAVNDDGYIYTSSGTNTESSAGLRLGIGAQYNFNSNWSSSLMYKYQWGNDYFSGMQTLALAVAYHFEY